MPPIPGSGFGDGPLVEAAVGGDRSALERLLRAHHDRIYAVCRRVTGNDADAADAAQNAMIAIVRAMERFDGRASFSTWSHRIAVNAALDENRRRQRRPALVLDEPGDGHRIVPDPRDQHGAAADRMDIDAALSRLPEDFKVAVVLRDLSGLSYAEIAEVLDVPVGTVRSRIARGRDLLAGMLRPSPSHEEGQR